jgi:hypothetical protein
MLSGFSIIDEMRQAREERLPDDLLIQRLRQIMTDQQAAIRQAMLQRYEVENLFEEHAAKASPVAFSRHGYGTAVDISGLTEPDVTVPPWRDGLIGDASIAQAVPTTPDIDIWQNRAARRAEARASRRASARAK